MDGEKRFVWVIYIPKWIRSFNIASFLLRIKRHLIKKNTVLVIWRWSTIEEEERQDIWVPVMSRHFQYCAVEWCFVGYSMRLFIWYANDLWFIMGLCPNKPIGNGKYSPLKIIYYNTPCCSNRMLHTFGYLPPELLVSRLLAHCPCSESQMIVLLPLKRPKFKICGQVWHRLVALGRLRHEDCCTCEAGISCMRKTLSGQRSGCWCWRDTPTGKGTSLSVRESVFSSQHMHHMEAHSL